MNIQHRWSRHTCIHPTRVSPKSESGKSIPKTEKVRQRRKKKSENGQNNSKTAKGKKSIRKKTNRKKKIRKKEKVRLKGLNSHKKLDKSLGLISTSSPMDQQRDVVIVVEMIGFGKP
jgi:hypothetical protein